MGSPCDPDTKGIDPSVGGLVWVRRRNGSWWPGRIMGVDELSESCLVSPRSGTPVKLLGREDASVDWYNLEKSKRVKAFRCGEYDECIEKAKASVANSSKKAVKYARREDAILHALELENALQSVDHPDFCSRLDRSGGEQNGVTESLTLPHPGKEIEHVAEESSSSGDMSNSAQELSQSGVSFEEPNQICASKEQSVQRRRRKTPNDSEDDGTEGNKRMRGLEDLGMGVVSSLKRKTSQVANVHEFLKRKNRRRPLTKVLESTTMVSVPVICEQLDSPNGSPLPGVSDCKVSGLESRESKGSFAMVVNKKSESTGVSCENGTLICASEHACDGSLIKQENEISSMSGLQENDSSDRLFDVPFVGEEKHSAGLSPIFVSCSSQKPQVGAGVQSSPSSQVETISLGNEDFNESGSTSSGAADINNISQRIEKGTSKWQLKGKRNSRHTTKNRKQYSRKYVEVDDESNAYLPSLGPRDLYSLGSSLKIDRNPICKSLTLDSGTYRAKSKPVTETKVDDFWGWSRLSHKEPHMGMKTAEVKLLLDCSPPPQRSLPYRQSRFSVNPKYQMSDFPARNYDADFSLYDVNLEVKASYRPQHVPYISLMSKLNGQAIIGHPLTVEVLDDGFCDLFTSGPECYLTSSSCEFDGLEENTSALEGADVDYEVKPNLGCVRIPTKHLTLQPCVSPSKSPKRKNGLLSKKIRKLSSLTGSHKRSEVEIKPVIEKLKGPAIACVPLKVAFSRINAALKSSMRPAPRILTSNKL